MIETRLRENEERLRLAMATAGIGTWRRDIEADRFELSPEARRIHGLLPDGEVSLAVWLAAAPIEDREHVMAQLAEGWGRQAPEISVQHRLVDPANARVRHIESRATYTYNPAGQPISSIGVIIDITERKERELELIRSEQRHRSIIETAADAIIIADEAGRILSVNPATLEMFGHADAVRWSTRHRRAAGRGRCAGASVSLDRGWLHTVIQDHRSAATTSDGAPRGWVHHSGGTLDR